MSEIVVVGASGWAGMRLVRRLAAAQADFSVVSHSDAGSARLAAAGAHNIVWADLDDFSALRAAFTRVRAVYAIPPSLHRREDELMINAVRAADICDVQHFTYHSVLHPTTPFLRNHLRKARVESVLRSSGMAWTILQPSVYAQLIVAMFAHQPAGAVRAPFDLDSKIAMVDLADCAEVGVRVLTEPQVYDYGTYELAGPTTTLRRCVAVVGRARGVDLVPEAVAPHQGPLPSAAQDNPEAAADMISTFAHYDQHGFRGNSLALAQLLGRTPASFADVVERQWSSSDAHLGG